MSGWSTWWVFLDGFVNSMGDLWKFLTTNITIALPNYVGSQYSIPSFSTSWLALLSLAGLITALIMRLIHLFNPLV